MDPIKQEITNSKSLLLLVLTCTFTSWYLKGYYDYNIIDFTNVVVMTTNSDTFKLYISNALTKGSIKSK